MDMPANCDITAVYNIIPGRKQVLFSDHHHVHFGQQQRKRFFLLPVCRHIHERVGKNANACLSFGELGRELGLDESRLHEAVELERDDRARVQPQRPRVLGKVPEDVRRVEETNLCSNDVDRNVRLLISTLHIVLSLLC